MAIHSVVYSARLPIVLFFIKAVVDFALPRRTNCLPAKCFITEISIRYLNNRTNRAFFCFVEHYYVFAYSLKFKGFPWLLLVILVFCLLFINNDSVVFSSNCFTLGIYRGLLCFSKRYDLCNCSLLKPYVDL